MIIRDARAEDAAEICAMYNEHVRGTIVTFEFDEVAPSEMEERIEKVRQKYPWIVLIHEGRLKGYAYATEWRKRVAYKQTVETAIYVDAGSQGMGFGRELYAALIERLKESGFHVALGAIALPNAASVALHESLGFRKVAEFPEVGRKFDRWIDVGFWQLAL